MSAGWRRGLLLLCLLATLAAAFWPQGSEVARPAALGARAAAPPAPTAVPAAPGVDEPPRPAMGSQRVVAAASAAGSSAAAVPMAVALTLFGPATPPTIKRTGALPAAPPPPAAAPEAPAPLLPPAPPPLRLRGLFAEGSGPPRALLEDTRGLAWLMSAGEWLDGSGADWQLVSIDAEGVLLRHRDGETRHRLRLPPPA